MAMTVLVYKAQIVRTWRYSWPKSAALLFAATVFTSSHQHCGTQIHDRQRPLRRRSSQDFPSPANPTVDTSPKSTRHTKALAAANLVLSFEGPPGQSIGMGSPAFHKSARRNPEIPHIRCSSRRGPQGSKEMLSICHYFIDLLVLAVEVECVWPCKTSSKAQHAERMAAWGF